MLLNPYKEVSEDLKKQDNKVGEVDQKKLVQSWVDAAQEKKKLKKYDVEISNKEGIHMVEIPDDIIENSTPLWEDFVVGKFLDLAPHVAKVHMVLNKIWKYGDLDTKVEVYEVNATTMRFKVSSSRAREKILRRGMWNIVGVPMIVTKWSPKTEEDIDKEDEAIPMWVHLENVPLHMYSWEGLSFITSTVGFPVKPHPETTSCSKMDEAKIFVKVDVSKELPKEITFSKDGKSFTVKFYYPWLPARCKLCDKWGHGEAVCGSKGKRKKNRNVSSSPPQDGNEVDANSPERVEKSLGADMESNTIKKIVGETSSKVQREESNVKLNFRKVAEVVNTNSWSMVSPGKTGRSLFISDQRDIVEVSASKFSVLSTEEAEEGELLDDEKNQVEKETVVIDNEDEESLETDLVEDSALDQQVQEEVKIGLRKGGRNARIPDANLGKSIRPSRRKR